MTKFKTLITSSEINMERPARAHSVDDIRDIFLESSIYWFCVYIMKLEFQYLLKRVLKYMFSLI